MSLSNNTQMYLLKTKHRTLLSDTITPVSIYLKLRDRFENPILLESSDYHSSDNSYSYICCSPLATFSVNHGEVTEQLPGNVIHKNRPNSNQEVIRMLSDFAGSFVSEPNEFKFTTNGLFGYMGYDAVQHYEDVKVQYNEDDRRNIPEIFYAAYRYIIVIDHFRNQLHLFEHTVENDNHPEEGLNELVSLIKNKNYPAYHFNLDGEESSNYNDQEFLKIINKGKEHCYRGDVFQIVLSRRFQNRFKGDEFNVYRALRSINPSPYLFYFDYGSYKLFGSSPEAQIVIKNDTATIFPIAGTFRRTGNDEADAESARKLIDDPKENSEHVMLVDLARNDLSRHGSDVKVDVFKEVQFYSHVIHLVSKVTGKLQGGVSPVQVVADTFPAGTLSGAPKHRAMQLINEYENGNRGYYGGAIGFLGFNSDFNHAIMIRSFMSKNNTLYYQAGAGVVAKSDSESELQEVNNKLAALRRAIKVAETIES